MNNYRSLLEVLKFTVPREVLTNFALACSFWHKLTDCDELWMTFIESEFLDPDSTPVHFTPKQRFRFGLKLSTLALISPDRLYLCNVKLISWQSLPLSTKIKVDKSSAWAIISSDGSLICCGGGAGFSQVDEHNGFSSAYKVSNTGEVWTLSDLRMPRKWHAVQVYDSVCYVFGGIEGVSEGERATSECEKMNTRTLDRWNRFGPMLSARTCFNPCLFRSKIYIFGGIANEGEVFQPESETFRPLSIYLEAYHCTSFVYERNIVSLTDSSAIYWREELNGETRSTEGKIVWGNSNPVVWGGVAWVPQSYGIFGVLKVDIQTLEMSEFRP